MPVHVRHKSLVATVRFTWYHVLSRFSLVHRHLALEIFLGFFFCIKLILFFIIKCTGLSALFFYKITANETHCVATFERYTVSKAWYHHSHPICISIDVTNFLTSFRYQTVLTASCLFCFDLGFFFFHFRGFFFIKKSTLGFMMSLIVIYVRIKIRSLTKNGSFKNTLSSGHKCVVYLIKKKLLIVEN